MTTTTAPDRPATESAPPLPQLVLELRELIVAYFKQETVVPLKQLGRYAAFGIVGSMLLGLGVLFVAIGGLRVLQTETDTTFAGDWSWAPYGITLVACVIVAALAARAIGSHKRRARRKGTVA